MEAREPNLAVKRHWMADEAYKRPEIISLQQIQGHPNSILLVQQLPIRASRR
jgi:hypothetical protein